MHAIWQRCMRVASQSENTLHWRFAEKAQPIRIVQSNRDKNHLLIDNMTFYFQLPSDFPHDQYPLHISYRLCFKLIQRVGESNFTLPCPEFPEQEPPALEELEFDGKNPYWIYGSSQ